MTMTHLEEGEEIIGKWRKHWFFILEVSVPVVLATVSPFLLLWLFHSLYDGNIIAIPGNAVALVFALGSLWLLLVLPFFYIVWTDYHLDVLILTNKRVIDIEQEGLFAREVSSFRLDRVQDITVEVKGFVETILHFGSVHIQTAGESKEFIAKYIPNPNHVKDIISKQHDTALDESRNVRIISDERNINTKKHIDKKTHDTKSQ